MPIFLNAFPLKIPNAELEALQIPYDKKILDGLRAQYGTTHFFRRQGKNILIFSEDGMFPISGTPQTISLKDNFDIFCSLVKDGLKRHLLGMGRNPSGFNPIELVSAKPEDNLLVPILGDAYPFKVCAKYAIDTRTVLGKVCKTPLRAREFIPSGVFCLLKRSRVLESSAPNAASTRLPALHGHLAQCRRTHPCARRICRRAIHKLPSANSIVRRAVFLASPR